MSVYSHSRNIANKSYYKASNMFFGDIASQDIFCVQYKFTIRRMDTYFAEIAHSYMCLALI